MWKKTDDVRGIPLLNVESFRNDKTRLSIGHDERLRRGHVCVIQQMTRATLCLSSSIISS